MKILEFVLLCFVVVSVSGGKKKKAKQATGEGIYVQGTVHIKLPKNHPEPQKVIVTIEAPTSNLPGGIEQESESCTEHTVEEEIKDKAHKVYACKYKITKSLGDHQGIIHIGALLEDDHIRDKHLIHGKHEAAYKRSHELAVPPSHRIDFMFDLEKPGTPEKPEMPSILIGVHIHGVVHLKVVGRHQPPKQIIVLIKTGSHPDKPIHTKSKPCSENKCHYDTMFYVVKEEEDFHVGAKMEEAKTDEEVAWSQKIHAVPRSLVINRDFNLHILTDGKLKVDLENTGKKKNVGHHGEGGNEGHGGHQGQDNKKKADKKKKGPDE